MELFGWNISIIRSKRKSVSIEIRAGEVIVRAPNRMRDKDIVRFVEIKKELIFLIIGVANLTD